MIRLFDGCYCSTPKVHPQNWKQIGASCKKDWYIYYRFYDPTITEAGKIKSKLIIFRGFNTYKTVIERRGAAAFLLQDELKRLSVEGFNPITGQYMAPTQEWIEFEIDPATPVIEAFKRAKERLSVTNRVKIGINSVINGLEKAALQLRYTDTEICKITRRHIKALLDQCGRNSKHWSNNRYNGYRGYLMMLYKELVELEAVPGNPIRDISKKQVTKRIKKTLTTDQRSEIDKHLANTFPAFRNFIHLFFHSGGRKPELLQLKPGMVDLKNQKYKCIIKKRRNYTEVERTIKSIAIPFWEYFVQDCPADHFIFGARFRPALKPMGEDMPTKYWRECVKSALNIQIDFYSLKHLNTTEVVDALDEQAAARLNAHTSTAMVVDIYDVRQKQRKHDRLKDVGNNFVENL